MACFFCKHFQGTTNHDDSIAGTCEKFHLEIEERIAHEDCSFYDSKECNKMSKKKELKSLNFNDAKSAYTKAVCGTCKYVDVPRNRKPCCSCYWLERESYYEEATND